MITFPSIPPISIRHRYVPLTPLSQAAATAGNSPASENLTAQQRSELVKVLDKLDKLEATVKGSKTRREVTRVDSVSNGTSVQSSILAANLDAAIGLSTPINIVTNGSFEQEVVTGDYQILGNVTGWSNVNGGIEVWREITQSADNEQNIELDVGRRGRLDTIEQVLTTVPGQVYELSFAYAPRPGVSSASNSFEVSFDGIKLDEIGATGGSFSSPDWKIYTYTVEATSANSSILFRETSSDRHGALLDAVSVRESNGVVGTSAVHELAVGVSGTRLSNENIRSGSIAINGTQVNVDINRDSLHDIIDAINAAATGVTASLVDTGSVNADALSLYRIELTTAGEGFSLRDDGTGLLAAMGLQAGAYGEVYETKRVHSQKTRGYRAANYLEEIQASLQQLAYSQPTAGRNAIQTAITSLFEGLASTHGAERLSLVGLVVNSRSEGFLNIDSLSRRRFARAVYQDNNFLDKLLLHGENYAGGGLIKELQQVIKTELKGGSGQRDHIVDTYA